MRIPYSLGHCPELGFSRAHAACLSGAAGTSLPINQSIQVRRNSFRFEVNTHLTATLYSSNQKPTFLKQVFGKNIVFGFPQE